MKSLNLPISEERLSSLLREHGVAEASVFGSFSRGENAQSSDLDLLVTYKAGTSLLDALTLQDLLEQQIGGKVDLVSTKSLRPRLKKRIEKDLRPLAGLS
jgi:predicted nucleotidyltransferase